MFLCCQTCGTLLHTWFDIIFHKHVLCKRSAGKHFSEAQEAIRQTARTFTAGVTLDINYYYFVKLREQASVRYLQRIVQNKSFQSQTSVQCWFWSKLEFLPKTAWSICVSWRCFLQALQQSWRMLSHHSVQDDSAAHRSRHLLSVCRVWEVNVSPHWCTLGVPWTHTRHWKRPVASVKGGLIWQVPREKGTGYHHGNLISCLTCYTPDTEGRAGRGEVGVLTGQRWQLSLQSWWDEVISPFMLQLVSTAVKQLYFFKVLSVFQRGLRSQQGLNAYPTSSLPSQLIHLRSKLLHSSSHTRKSGCLSTQREAQLKNYSLCKTDHGSVKHPEHVLL